MSYNPPRWLRSSVPNTVDALLPYSEPPPNNGMQRTRFARR